MFDFFVGDPVASTEEGREAMRPGVLRLGGVTSMFVEPPDPRYAFTTLEAVRVDGDFGAYPGEAQPPDDGSRRASARSSGCDQARRRWEP